MEMRQRSKLLQNYASVEIQSDGNEDDFGKLLVSDSESEDDSNEINETLVTSHNHLNKRKVQSEDDANGARANVTTDSGKKKLNLQPETENVVSSDTEINTEDIRARLNKLLESDDSDDSIHKKVTTIQSGNTKGMKRRRIKAFESDSDNDEDTVNISSIQIKQHYSDTNTKPAIVAKKKKAVIESDDEQ